MKKPLFCNRKSILVDIFCLFCLLFSFLGFAQSKQIFENPQLKTIISQHKTVAILPYKVSITYKKQPKNFNAEANRD